jgi:hypothetical protein
MNKFESAIRSFFSTAPIMIVCAIVMFFVVWAFQAYFVGVTLFLGFFKANMTPTQLRGMGMFSIIAISALAFGLYVIASILKKKKFGRITSLLAFAFWTCENQLFDAFNSTFLTFLYAVFGVATALLFFSKTTVWFDSR